MSRNEMREEEEEEQSEYTRRYSSTTSPTVGHACFKYKHPPLPVDSQINPPFSLIRVHDVVRPLRKTSGGCMFGRRKFTEETGWRTRQDTEVSISFLPTSCQIELQWATLS